MRFDFVDFVLIIYKSLANEIFDIIYRCYLHQTYHDLLSAQGEHQVKKCQKVENKGLSIEQVSH